MGRGSVALYDYDSTQARWDMALEALIVGRSLGLSWALPHLLWRAGFCVDIVLTSPLLRLSRFTRSVHIVEADDSVAEFACGLIRTRGKPYDWVIAADDVTLAEFAEQERRTGKPSPCLPLLQGAGREHVYSKIGLSRSLAAAGIKTPPFRAARSCEEAISAAREIGYPVLLKQDVSGGGGGVFECADDAAILELRHLFGRTLLVQKKIEGREIDLSAIYLEGELVHFSYATVENTISPFGPSSLRSYLPLAAVPQAVFDEVAALGRALGIHGFTNISCIDAADGSGRTFFEADLRPNVWVDFPRFFGEDAALRIRDWFAGRAGLSKENSAGTAAAVTIPYFLRLGTFELLTNRHRVWHYIPFADARLVRRLLAQKAVMSTFALGKWLLSKPQRRKLRQKLVSAGVFYE